MATTATNHFVQRCVERGVSIEDVNSVLRNGEATETHFWGQTPRLTWQLTPATLRAKPWLGRLRRLRVITTNTGRQREDIITTFWSQQ